MDGGPGRDCEDFALFIVHCGAGQKPGTQRFLIEFGGVGGMMDYNIEFDVAKTLLFIDGRGGNGGDGGAGGEGGRGGEGGKGGDGTY
jgi:hypothetical protein